MRAARARLEAEEATGIAYEYLRVTYMRMMRLIRHICVVLFYVWSIPNDTHRL